MWFSRFFGITLCCRAKEIRDAAAASAAGMVAAAVRAAAVAFAVMVVMIAVNGWIVIQRACCQRLRRRISAAGNTAEQLDSR